MKVEKGFAMAAAGLLLVAACSSKKVSPTPDAGTPTDGAAVTDAPIGADAADAADVPPAAADASDVASTINHDADALLSDPNATVVNVLDRVRINSRSELGNFQSVSGPIDFAGGPYSDVRLLLSLDTTCFPFERWKDDPPPAGQNWPAQCDAFDRLFEVMLDPRETPTAKPGIELVRAVTPFGGPLQFEADITDVANGLPGAHKLGARIDTWPDQMGQVTGSSGGWFVSVKVVLKKGPAPRDVLAVVPLFHDFQKTAASAANTFDVPAGATKTRIEYRATGHTAEPGPMGAGCIGPPEEFCQRMHTFTVDDQPAGSFSAWRSSCNAVCTLVTLPGPNGRLLNYCRENPCGAVGSVRAPRANWCPGSVTPPQLIEPANLPAGPHTFKWTFSGIETGGHWRVSAVMFAYR